MQLSWIDPEVLRDLVAKLQDPEPLKPAGRDLSALHALAFERAVEASLMSFAPAAPAAAVAPAPAPAAVPAPESEPAPAPASAPEQVVAPDPIPPDPHVARIRQQLEIVRARARKAGLLPDPPAPAPPPPPPPSPLAAVPPPPIPPAPVPPAPSPVAAPFALAPTVVAPPVITVQASEDSLGDRLGKFVTWARLQVSAEELIIVDDHGDTLWGSQSRSDLGFSALLALNAALRSSAGTVCAPPPVIRSRISPDRELTLLPCQTRHGTVTMALLNASGLSDESAKTVRDTLISAIEGRSG